MCNLTETVLFLVAFKTVPYVKDILKIFSPSQSGMFIPNPVISNPGSNNKKGEGGKSLSKHFLLLP
jgi:hypothetical protein